MGVSRERSFVPKAQTPARGMERAQALSFSMAPWIKILFWIAVMVLPGGLLLVPFALAVHRKRPALRPAVDAPER